MEAMACERPILQVENLKMHFPLYKGLFRTHYADVKAADDISFAVDTGKVFGLVGESGCGKTTVGKSILRIYRPTSGKILYNGVDISRFSRKEMRPYRREIQMIFQDPFGSLDPRQSVYAILREALKEGRKYRTEAALKRRVEELLYSVELSPEIGERYPHEMSGGQRQRIGIARALACDPKLLICDEPVSALDVSIQAQIINLFRKLQQELGLTYIFVAHDLAVVHHIADTIAVMYLGHIVEIMDAHEIYGNPMHPYTRALISAVPITDYYEERSRKRLVLPGEVPSPIDAPSGCPFHPRCAYASEICKAENPELTERGKGHHVACHCIPQ